MELYCKRGEITYLGRQSEETKRLRRAPRGKCPYRFGIRVPPCGARHVLGYPKYMKARNLGSVHGFFGRLTPSQSDERGYDQPSFFKIGLLFFDTALELGCLPLPNTSRRISLQSLQSIISNSKRCTFRTFHESCIGILFIVWVVSHRDATCFDWGAAR